MIRRYCPPELQRYLEKWSIKISGFFNPYIQISIHEYLGNHLKPHKAYAIAEAYLSANSSKDAKRLKAEMGKDNGNKLMLSLDEYEKTTDEFEGVKVSWISGKSSPPPRPMLSYFPDPDKKRYKEMITGSYLEHVMKTGKEIQARNKQRKLYTNGHNMSCWSHIVFEHPATFKTIAMDPEKKEEIIRDLLTFTKSRNFYARIGKAWKRGYLLYGPPRTGKSTMIAAMANLLDYDVYDLELTSVRGRTIKKRASEESEKSKKETKEESVSKVTLSGLLNFIDGLWYLQRITSDIEAPHPLFPKVEELIEEVEITPADVAESLMPKSAKDGPEKCLLNLIQTLEKCK
ncbi:hypothetical protein BUALT_Bualt02G0142700 [Buddleja alternifolia]|uniref:Mitochondrial chaperone BCS1 n=1 Tax=Buddleja alternifolia TaxID=168488 RepID=A0AAV6Y299_9LAMI|nr:hypothetical protein BUALT_Bualt02G0142700 [Buddleja alternifolia]